MEKIANALTFDIEEFFQADAVAKSKTAQAGFESRVEESTEKILSILKKHNVKATFFVLGEIAKSQPWLVKKISESGHEIASHSYSHKNVCQQTKKEFGTDLKKSVATIKNACGKKPIGFRAPNFSINRNSFWAFDALKQNGFKYDSSIFPIKHFNYGIPNYERFPTRLENGLIEFPISTFRTLGVNLPFSGGFYFRATPLFLIKHFIRKINSQGNPVVVYLHPWELDAGHPKARLGAFNSMRQYYNVKETAKKLESVLKEFSFDSVEGALARL